MEHGVAERDQYAQSQDQTAGQEEPAAVAVDHGLHGETHRQRGGGDGTDVHQPPGEGLELAAELLSVEPPEEGAARTDVRDSRVGVRKVTKVHAVPAESW